MMTRVLEHLFSGTMKGKPKMKLKNMLLKFALCAVVALSSCAALADVAQPSFHPLGLVARKVLVDVGLIEVMLMIGAVFSVLMPVYIFLRRRRRFAAAEKVLILAFLISSFYLGALVIGWLFFSDQLNERADERVIVVPKPGEPYREYMERVSVNPTFHTNVESRVKKVE